MPETTTCVHHWLIEPAAKGTSTSPGRCIHCGEVRAFKNSIEYDTIQGVPVGKPGRPKQKDGRYRQQSLPVGKAQRRWNDGL